MKIYKHLIEKYTILYILLPVVIFFIFWLKPLISIPLITALAFLLCKLNKYRDDSFFKISKTEAIVVILIVFIWCILSGIGYLYYQSADWNLRNAIFRDLINYSHPVIYNNDSALIYFFHYFLPATVVGKALHLAGMDLELAFKIANILHLLWVVTGITLLFGNIGIKLKQDNTIKHAIALSLLFIFFSGLDILLPGNTFEQYHIEWHWQWQFSSNTTLMFWVHNQTVIPWLCTILLINNKEKIENFGIYLLPCLCCAPLPFLGLFLYSIVFFLQDILKNFKKTFTFENLTAILFAIPIISFYQTNGALKQNHIYLDYKPNVILFLICEMGIYCLLIAKENYKKLVFWITILSLILFSNLWFGYAPDVCMRCTIPALLVLYCLVADFILKNKNNIIKNILMFFLILGCITPLFEFYRSYVYIFKLNKRPITSDELISLEGKITDKKTRTRIFFNDGTDILFDFKNFGTKNYKNGVFFKYFSKRN